MAEGSNKLWKPLHWSHCKKKKKYSIFFHLSRVMPATCVCVEGRGKWVKARAVWRKRLFIMTFNKVTTVRKKNVFKNFYFSNSMRTIRKGRKELGKKQGKANSTCMIWWSGMNRKSYFLFSEMYDCPMGSM